MAARELRQRLGKEHQVRLFEPSPWFHFGLAKLWALTGRRSPEAGRRPLSALRPSVDLVAERVESIDVKSRSLRTPRSQFDYDFLVLATGARLATDAPPGFADAHNLYDAGAIGPLHERLSHFPGGSIVFFIAGVPIKCPPAPYEAALLVEDYLRARGVREKARLEVVTPEPRPLPVAPASCGSEVQGFLRTKRIQYTPNTAVARVDSAHRRIELADGTTRDYDVLIGVPQHRAPEVLVASGLVDASGWVPVDPRRLATAHPGVFAIGDCTLLKTPSGRPLPKAAVFAEAQALVVAHNLAAEIEGRSERIDFDGRGHCYLEIGDGLATAVDGEFFATPEPNVTLRVPTKESLGEKEAFEAERLRAWFGS